MQKPTYYLKICDNGRYTVKLMRPVFIYIGIRDIEPFFIIWIFDIFMFEATEVQGTY